MNESVSLDIVGNKISVVGDLVFETVNEVAEQGSKAIANIAEEVEIDFSGVGLVDSSALSLIILWLRCSLALGTKIHLINVSPRLIDLARSCGLEEILPCN